MTDSREMPPLSDMEALKLVRRISQAGLASCRDALADTRGDVYLACKTLMSKQQILDAYHGWRTRSWTGSSVKDPPDEEETTLINRLHQSVLDQGEFDDTFPPLRETPLSLPPGIPSFAALVERVMELCIVTPDEASLQAAVMTIGFSPEDADYVLDRIAGGAVRARMEQQGSASAAPDKKLDPLAYAAYLYERPHN